jgi:large subunit ribosomal protein L5
MDLKEKYIKEIAPALLKELEINNAMEIPKLEKVVINM